MPLAVAVNQSVSRGSRSPNPDPFKPRKGRPPGKAVPERQSAVVVLSSGVPSSSKETKGGPPAQTVDKVSNRSAWRTDRGKRGPKGPAFVAGAKNGAPADGAAAWNVRRPPR